MDTNSASAFLERYELSPEQLDQLRDLLGKSMGIDSRVEQFRQAAEEATSHHMSLLQDPLSGQDIRDNAERLFRAARVDQAKASGELGPLFDRAGQQGLGKAFEDIRTLSDLAQRDSLAAKELMQVHRALNLPVPEGIKSKYVGPAANLEDAELDNGITLDDPERELADRASKSAQESTAQGVDETQLDNEVAGDTGLQGLDRRRDPRAVPEHIVSTYHRKGEKYLDPKDPSALIFLDKGDSLKTARNFDGRAIRAMIDVAEARGWHSVKLTGTPEFRRAAWYEAASRGLEVKGYKPTEAEIEAAAKAAKAAGVENSVQQQQEKQLATQGKPAHSGAQSAPGAQTEHDPAGTPEAQTGRPQSVRARGAQPTGRLIEHGAAPFEFNEDNKRSYFVKVATAGGEKTYWGIDFPRALEENSAKVGQEITIKNLGKKAVTVSEDVRDDDGKVVGQREVVTHRNTWEVTPFENEQVKAFKQATTPEAKTAAAKANPNLANAFAVEAAMQKFAETRLQPGDVEAFMEAQRQLIQKDLSDGIAYPDIHIRDKAKTHKPRERVAEHGHEH